MITPDELRSLGFYLDDDFSDSDWTTDGVITRFNLNDDGAIDWFAERSNFHGLQVQPITDIETFKRFWFMVTGKTL